MIQYEDIWKEKMVMLMCICLLITDEIFKAINVCFAMLLCVINVKFYLYFLSNFTDVF